MSTIRPALRGLITAAAALVLGAGLFAVVPASPAFASPCNYGKQVYCDGGDEPHWQWDGVDDFECVGIPGVGWNGDTPDYSAVVGKVYYFQNGGYTLVHDSTAPPPAPPAPPAPAQPAPPAPAQPAPAAPAPASGGSGSGTPQQAEPAPAEGEAVDPVAPEPSETPVAAEASGARAGNVQARGVLEPGGVVTLTGSGIAPEADFVIEIHSDPRALTTGSSDAAGAFSVDVELPADLEPGVHTLVVLVDGEEVASRSITVVDVASGGGSASAFWLLGGLGVLAAGALAAHLVIRSRRSRGADGSDGAAEAS